MSTRDLIEGFSPGNRTHDHARTPAVWRVIDGAVAVMGERAKVVHPEIDQAGVNCLANERQPQRIEVLGKDRDDVDPHD